MPIRDIADCDGSFKKRAGLITSIVMMHPHDKKRREELIAAAELEDLVAENIPAPPELVSIQLDSPGISVFEKGWHSAAPHGDVAGNILLFILRYACHRPDDATVRKEIHVSAQHIEAINHRKKQKFPGSPSWIKSAWSEYKSVSHLWGAWALSGYSEDVLNDQNLSVYLATAEWLRKFAERHSPPPQASKRSPLLVPNECRTVPELVNVRPTPCELSPLSDDELGWLASYRAD